MSIEFKRTEHSDIIVHWTGKDIDKDDKKMHCCKRVSWRKFRLKPIERPSLIDDHGIIAKYLERLRDTLKFGMWMMPDSLLPEEKRGELSSSKSEYDGRHKNLEKNTSPIVKTCFTELKLSEARQHAYEYGRLGFGVKRSYLFRRARIPMIYFQNKRDSSDHPNWISESILQNPCASSYLKYMSETEDMNYKYLAESEWRIIHPKDNLGVNCKDSCKFYMNHQVLNKIKHLIVDIKGDLEQEVKKYGNGISTDDLSKFKDKIEQFDEKKRPRYLLPFDFELAVIIYPCPIIKILAENDCEIRRLIRKTRYWSENEKSLEKFYEKNKKFRNFLKAKLEDHKKMFDDLKIRLGGNDKDSGTGERMMLPMEIDLDTISHF